MLTVFLAGHSLWEDVTPTGRLSFVTCASRATAHIFQEGSALCVLLVLLQLATGFHISLPPVFKLLLF